MNTASVRSKCILTVHQDVAIKIHMILRVMFHLDIVQNKIVSLYISSETI